MPLDAALHFNLKWTTKGMKDSRVILETDAHRYQARIQELLGQQAAVLDQRDSLYTQNQDQAASIAELATQLAATSGLASELETQLRVLQEQKADYAFPSQAIPTFELDAYLADCPEPATYSLLKLKFILQGSTGITDPYERVDRFANYLSSQPPSTNPKDLAFVSYLREGIKQLNPGADPRKQQVLQISVNLARDYLSV